MWCGSFLRAGCRRAGRSGDANLNRCTTLSLLPSGTSTTTLVPGFRSATWAFWSFRVISVFSVDHPDGAPRFVGRSLVVFPTKNWAAQVSLGRIRCPEALEPGDQVRATTSLEYTRPVAGGSAAPRRFRGLGCLARRECSGSRTPPASSIVVPMRSSETASTIWLTVGLSVSREAGQSLPGHTRSIRNDRRLRIRTLSPCCETRHA